MRSAARMRVLLFGEGVHFSHQLGAVVEQFELAGATLRMATTGVRGDVHDRLREVGVPSHALGGTTSRDFPRTTARLHRLVRSEGVEIVHAVDPTPAALAAVATRGTSTKCVYHWQHSKLEWPRTLLNRVASTFADLVVPCAEAVAADASRATRGRVPVKVVHNGVPPPREVSAGELVRLRSRLEIDPNAFILSSVARLRPEKGIQVTIEALADIAARLDRPLAYIVAGDGPYRAELEFMARASEVPVVFVGHQTDVAPWFQVADVVLMPSFNEAFGLAAAEAMACRRPLIASDVGGLREVVSDGVTGILVAPNAPRELASATLRIANDDEVRAQMGSAAYDRYRRNFTVEAMVNEWMTEYRELLDTG